jgi:hypothetical protein
MMVSAIACTNSSSTGADGGGGSGGGSCTITLTGAQSTTAACVAAWETLDGSATSEWGAVVEMKPAGFASIGASFQIDGTPTSRTYTGSDFIAGGASVVTTSGQAYAASDSPNPGGTVGALIITNVTSLGDNGSAVDYTTHGSFTATLAQQGSGSVMMSISF